MTKYGSEESKNQFGKDCLYMTGVDGVRKECTHYDSVNPDGGMFNRDEHGQWWQWIEGTIGGFDFDPKPEGKWCAVSDLSGRRILPWGEKPDSVIKLG